ncbi:MAG: hypothetical protein P1U36_06190 [Legionellaceae bacterium]|nr:hypothetical protein [Legionellaceae bacterium]
MNKMTQAILYPKRTGLKGKAKPLALLVHSPHDELDAAVNFQASVSALSSVGYATANKARITFDESEPNRLNQVLKPMHTKNAKITLWFEAHGTLGWLFGKNKCKDDELKWAGYFIDFMQAVEKQTGAQVNTVVLSACYTANEVVNKEERTYLNSPARILSLLNPDIHVLGFVGQNANAKVTNVYYREDDDTYYPKTLKPEGAAVIFKGGFAIESYHKLHTKSVYCTHEYTPDFIKDACKLIYEDEEKSEEYYESCLAIEEIQINKYDIDEHSYGEQQRKTVFKMLEYMDAELLDKVDSDENTGCLTI